MSKNFNRIELASEDKSQKQLQIYEREFPSNYCIAGIDHGLSSDLIFKDEFLKIYNHFYNIVMMQPELKTAREDGYPFWIMASEISPEDQAKATRSDRGEAIAAYILLVLHTKKAKPSGELDEANKSVVDEDANYGEIVAFDIRDKYLSYEVIESLKKRAEYVLWKHNIAENNKHKFI